MTVERLDLRQAVERYAPDGSTLYLGNFGRQLFAVGHELIRQGRRDIHLVIGSGGILMDQLLGAGVLSAATFAHCWSPVGPVPAWNFRRACERGTDVRLCEVSLGVLCSALRAGAWGVPFMPAPDLAGTVYDEALTSAGLVDRAACSFGSWPVVRALTLDTAFVYVDLADEEGNGVLHTPVGEAALAARAARNVVLVAGRVVGPAELRAQARACAFPGFLTAGVVEEPLALHPDGADDEERDVGFYRRYGEAAATEEGFRAWLERWVLEPRTPREYAERLEEERVSAP